MVDYIVVGLGLAGTTFCETLRRNKKTFLIVNDESQTSSKVAGGLSNPVILKRFTLAWKANELLPFSQNFYMEMEKELDVKLLVDQPILRKFSSVEEQNLWFEASDKETLKNFLPLKLVRNSNNALIAPLDFGELKGAYRLRTELLLDNFIEKRISTDQIIGETLIYQDLKIAEDHVSYHGKKARNIVFAEGFGLKNNPFFNYLPMQGSKGEYLLIESDSLKETNAIKSSIFVIPLSENKYLVGANYNSKDKDNNPSEETRYGLLEKLNKLINCPYKVVGHTAGVRPTVKDRRPLIGKHPNHGRLSVLNGFGSHGVMIAPWAAQELYLHLEEAKPLDTEVDIHRFKGMWKEKDA